MMNKGKSSHSGKKGFGVAANTIGKERQHGKGEHSGSMTGGGSHTLDHAIAPGRSGPKKSAGSNPGPGY